MPGKRIQVREHLTIPQFMPPAGCKKPQGRHAVPGEIAQKTGGNEAFLE